ncbi:MAG: phosphoglucosamine mutase [Defluviitaleaceae bacterium]|nr:phosphoglucosamine mutase [Defluviitaleaceae bacterium]
MVKFGTDGIRGVANTELTAKIAFEVGQAGALVLCKGVERPQMLIASDTRHSCDMLVMALSAGVCSVGVDVVDLGILPSPGIAALVKKYGAAAGIMVSASHNPYYDNGIKFFTAEGFKPADAVEREIEATIGNVWEEELPKGTAIGSTFSSAKAQDDYVEFLKECVFNSSFEGMTIALDCANGAAFEVAPDVFEQLGATVHIMGDSPDGANINDKCGSTYISTLVEFMKDKGCDCGFAFDGDGDRLFAVDELGNVLDGDMVMAVLAQRMAERDKLAKNTVVATVMSNLGFINAMRDSGIEVEQTAVGDRYVLERMKEGGFTLGGEQSGHIILYNHQTTGDGLLAALAVALIMKTSGKTLSELNIVKPMPQVLVNVKVSNDSKEKIMEQANVAAAIADLETKYSGSKGRVLIRPSGTEPLLRIMIEGVDMGEIKADATSLANMMEGKK